MTREQYQKAFSQLEPSYDLIEAALSQKDAPSARRRTRMWSGLLAAALAVAVLAGTVFAAVHFQWFTVESADSIVQPTHDLEAVAKDENSPAAPQNLFRLDGEASGTYIGFTLPAAYQNGQDTLNCRMLGKGLYGRYYRNPDPRDPASPILTAEIIYGANYLTRYSSEVVKEEELNGMQTVWLRLDSSADGCPQYCLFLRNNELGCFVVVASTSCFEEAEQLATDLRFEDSGIIIEQTADEVCYGFHLEWTPEDMPIDAQTTMADRWDLANATLYDETLELNHILLGINWAGQGQVMCNIGVWIKEDLTDIAPIEHGTVYKIGTIGGHEARWVYGYGGDTFIQLLFQEEQVQLIASISCCATDPENGETVEIPAEEGFIKTAEHILEAAELIPVDIAEPAPAKFYPFVVG